jgi:hypothetical protein
MPGGKRRLYLLRIILKSKNDRIRAFIYIFCIYQLEKSLYIPEIRRKIAEESKQLEYLSSV